MLPPTCHMMIWLSYNNVTFAAKLQSAICSMAPSFGQIVVIEINDTPARFSFVTWWLKMYYLFLCRTMGLWMISSFILGCECIWSFESCINQMYSLVLVTSRKYLENFEWQSPKNYDKLGEKYLSQKCRAHVSPVFDVTILSCYTRCKCIMEASRDSIKGQVQ